MNIKLIFKDDPNVNILYDQKDESETYLKNRTAKAFYQPVVAPTVRQGAIALLQVCEKNFFLN
jgi:hypothetical protein